jgi:hypothetical protein
MLILNALRKFAIITLALAGLAVFLYPLVTAFQPEFNSITQKVTPNAVVAEAAPAEVQLFAEQFNARQLNHFNDYLEFDVTDQPKMDGMAACWDANGDVLSYVMQRGDSYYAAILDASTDGTSEVVSSGNNSARWDDCNKADTSADM